MDLRDFVQRDSRLDPAVLMLETWQGLDDDVATGATALSLAEAPPDALAGLPTETLRLVLDAVSRYRRWRDERASLERRREEAGRAPLPSTVLDATIDVGSLRAVERAAGALPARSVPDDTAWAAALEGALGLWERSFALARRDASVHAALQNEHPQAADFADHAGSSHRLEELPPHRWLALRRGERSGALTLTFVLPEDAIREQLVLVLAALAPALGDRPAESALAEVVLDPLPGELRRVLDEAGAEGAISAATREYVELLTAPPLGSGRVGGVHIGGGQRSIGLAVVDGAGQLVASARIAMTEGWTQRLLSWLASEEVRHVAVPTQSAAPERLAELRRSLAGGEKAAPTLVAVRPAALSEARQAFMEGRRRVTPESAAAAVLAQRAAVPARAWAAVDPVRLGLAEYQSDLDEDALREAFAVARAVALRTAPGRSERTAAATTVAGRGPSPLVRTLGDLRPGMVVPGVITNLTHFGAFVDIGLPQQGLIHVSDLADNFVQDPAEVVRPGQQVQARVLSVDPGRGRISLSLRSDSRPRGPARESTSSSPRPGGGVRPRGGGSDRQKALRDLEKLFDR